MMKSSKKLLDSVRTTLLAPAENGTSPDDVKEIIIHLLSPYFKNQNVLDEVAISLLPIEAVNIARLNNDPWAKGMFLLVLDDYHRAKSQDKTACLKGFASFQNQTLKASSEYVSIINLHRNSETELVELSLEDFKYEAFKSIGALIEASLQPYLKLLLLQIRICRGKANPEQDLDVIDLGDVVNELCQCSGYEELFAPPPWKIRLNQWRNIAQHHKSRVEKNEIIGTYGIGSKQQNVVLTREELFYALKRLFSVFSAIKCASTIFFVDNLDEIKPFVHIDELQIRPDIKIFHLASSFATQGFDLKEILVKENVVYSTLQDVMAPDENEAETNYRLKRVIHSSQFVLVIWSHFPEEQVIIKHLDKQGQLRCSITCKGSDCEAVSKGEIEFEELANRVNIAFEIRYFEN